ncbi:MAG: hypothetical protein KDI27_06685 [Gammaproteobacteria bacterium]|nr:hypothetical protein [Gammaproteobacteria bacterium]MCP5416235.1 hypothetical protein [Chromatiaceae bacterium]
MLHADQLARIPYTVSTFLISRFSGVPTGAFLARTNSVIYQILQLLDWTWQLPRGC